MVVLGPPLLKLIPNLHLDGATTAVAQAATFITTIAMQMRSQLTRASQFIEYANDVRNKGELLKKQALANLSPEKKEALRAYDEAQAKLDTAVKRKSDLEREIVETQDQLDALKAGRLSFVSAPASKARIAGEKASFPS
jgi:chromosome segregation ATPase